MSNSATKEQKKGKKKPNIKDIKLEDIKSIRPLTIISYKGKARKLSVVVSYDYSTGQKECKRITIPVAESMAEKTFNKYKKEGKDPIWI